MLRPRVGQKEAPRLGNTICYGQELARKSHRDSAVRFVAAKRGPERATKTRQYLLPPNVGHRDSAVRFYTANKSWPKRATETRQYDLLRPNVGQKEPPSFGSTICYDQPWARKSHRDTAVRFVTAKRGPERATETRQFDVFRPNVGQKEPPRLGSTISYRQTWARTAIKTRQYDLLRPRVGQKEPPRLGSTICGGQTWARKSHQDSAVRFVTAKKSWPERATETRQHDLLRLRVGQKRGTETRLYDLLRANLGQEEPPRPGSTICYGQTWARKSYQNSAVRFFIFFFFFVSLLQPRVGHKEPPRLGSTICYGQPWARKSTGIRQYDLL